MAYIGFVFYATFSGDIEHVPQVQLEGGEGGQTVRVSLPGELGVGEAIAVVPAGYHQVLAHNHMASTSQHY